jgi:hypothetical protein
MRKWIGAGALMVGVAAAPLALTAVPANAAQSTQTITCQGQELTIRSNSNNSKQNGGWESVQILSGGSGHLTPTSFSGAATDTTVNQVIFQFSSTKGNGNANHNKQTVTCTQVEVGTLGDFLDPGEQPPPGTSVTDQVVFNFTATAVHKQ